jgi:hypothetical protein
MGGALKALNPINVVKNVADKALSTFGNLGDTLGKVMKGDLGALFKPQNIMAVAGMMGGPFATLVPTAFSLGTALAAGRFDPLKLASLVTSQFGGGLGGQFGGIVQDLLQGRSPIDTFVSKFSTLGVQNPLLNQLIGRQLGQIGFDVSDAENLLRLPQNQLLEILNLSRGFSLNG